VRERRRDRRALEGGDGVTRVLHLSVVHKPDDPRIYERECRTLAQAGYEVMYMVPGAEPGRDDAGVVLAPLPQRSRKTRFLSSVEITNSLRKLKPDVLHVHDPELLTLFPAAKALVPRLVYDMHEYVVEAVGNKPYLPARVRPVASQTTAVAQRRLAALGAGVVVVVEDQLDALGSTPELRLVLPNYPRVERFEGAEPVPELAADPRLKLIYVGSLSRARGCTMMLDVMEQLEEDEAVLYLGGTFNDPALELEVGERLALGLADRVKLLGRVPPPELPRYLAAADVVWVPSQPDNQYSHPTVPTKLLEGMTMRLAALVSNMPGRGELVRLEECGLAVEPGAEGHLRGLRRLLMNRGALPEMGARGRRAVERRYSWEAVQDDLVAFYGSLCAGLP
jgi:glycosyltransferase involved in cell wall biosynthesis